MMEQLCRIQAQKCSFSTVSHKRISVGVPPGWGTVNKVHLMADEFTVVTVNKIHCNNKLYVVQC